MRILKVKTANIVHVWNSKPDDGSSEDLNMPIYKRLFNKRKITRRYPENIRQHHGNTII